MAVYSLTEIHLNLCMDLVNRNSPITEQDITDHVNKIFKFIKYLNDNDLCMKGAARVPYMDMLFEQLIKVVVNMTLYVPEACKLIGLIRHHQKNVLDAVYYETNGKPRPPTFNWQKDT